MPVPEAGRTADLVALSAEERSAVVEGLARIVSGLPEGVTVQMALQLVTPMIARAQSLAATGACFETSSGFRRRCAGRATGSHCRLFMIV